MAKIGRPGLSGEKTTELWERWKAGQYASDIARALARTKRAIHHVLAFNGDCQLIRPESTHTQRGRLPGLDIETLRVNRRRRSNMRIPRTYSYSASFATSVASAAKIPRASFCKAQ